MLRSHRTLGLLLAVGAFFTICEPASAYIDAGSGSYLLQILFAALFGAAYTIKSTWRNLRANFARRHHGSALVADGEAVDTKVA